MTDPAFMSILEETNIHFMKMFKETSIFHVVDKMFSVWFLVRNLEGYTEEKLVKCINEYIDELKSEDNNDDRTWDYFFSLEELLKDMMIYYIDCDSYEWVEMFNKHTDYSTSEISEFITQHCDHFGHDPDKFNRYL